MNNNEIAPKQDIIAEAGERFEFFFQLTDDFLRVESVADTSPIQVTVKYHGKTTGNKGSLGGIITSDGRDSNANGTHALTVIDAHTLALDGTTSNGPTARPIEDGFSTPRNCTGGSVAMQLRRSAAAEGDPIKILDIEEIDILTGDYCAVISVADLLELSETYENLAYDIIYTDSDGKPHKELKGNFHIDKVVTRS